MEIQNKNLKSAMTQPADAAVSKGQVFNEATNDAGSASLAYAGQETGAATQAQLEQAEQNPEGVTLESVHLPFQGIVNCRDMAGIVNKQGLCIKPGMLYRSANLHKASDQDIYTLQQMGLENIVDLRTDMEMAMDPDRVVSAWQLYHLPIVKEHKLAASQGGQFHLASKALKNTGLLLEEAYPLLVMTEQAQAMWKQFFGILMAGAPTLWHCTQGKDRTGMAAILLLNALDVDEQKIINDYLQTNLYLHAGQVKEDIAARALLGREAAAAMMDIDAMSQARMEYYNAAKRAVEENYGSWKGYLEQALGLQPADFERLQQLYLEG